MSALLLYVGFHYNRSSKLMISNVGLFDCSQSEQELSYWIEMNSALDGEFMIVTCSKKSPKKCASSVLVRYRLNARGWSVRRSFTLNGDLVGRVVSAA